MTDLTPKNYLTSGATTDAQFQEGIGALYDFVSQLAVGAGPQYPEIVDGYLVPDESSCFIIIDTENDTATDVLTNISPQYTGVKTIYLKPTANGRSITLKHMGGGTGQLFLAAEADITMDNRNCMMALHYNQTLAVWEELWRNWGLYIPSNNARNEIRTALGLGTAAQYNVGTASGNIPLVSNLGALAFKGIIDAANLVQDRILTPAKFSNGTPNQLIGYNSEGVATSIAMPSSKVLIRNKVFNFDYASKTLTIPDGVYGLDVVLVGGGGGGSSYYAGGGGSATKAFGISCGGGYGGRWSQTDATEDLANPGVTLISLTNGLTLGDYSTANAHWYDFTIYAPAPGESTPAVDGGRMAGMGGTAGRVARGSATVPGDKGGPGATFTGVLYNPSGASLTTTVDLGGGGAGGTARPGTADVAGGKGSPGYASFSWIEPIA